MIGYAASVDVVTHASDENILREILRSIKQCCYEQSLHKINIPLLGTGAGQLCPKTSWDCITALTPPISLQGIIIKSHFELNMLP